MSRLNLLAFFVFITSLAVIKLSVPGNDKNKEIWRGLLQFTEAAEKQLTDKPIPDLKYWRSQRIRTIETLEELRQKLDNVCFYTNCGKAAGSGMGIICALTALSTFLMSLIGIPISIPVMSVGGFTCPTGYLTREASLIIESILSKKYQNELQAVLMKDKELSRSLNEWLKFSPNLEEEFRNIFGFDFKSKDSISFIILNEFHRLFIVTKNFKKSLDLLKQGKYSSFIGKGIGIEDLQLFSKRMQDSPEISNKIRIYLSILSDLIQISQNEIEIFRNPKVERMFSSLSFILDKVDIKIPPTIEVPAFLLLKVLDLAKEVGSFIDATKIIKDGKCPYSDGIIYIIDMLKLELTTIESSFPFTIKQ
ncbi:uncharacterized protein LOC129956440 [Argiope bruennichi]|uniref:uncharacterized protein LOC129956440 n=1 Tax=Argiope bruennichi TaxID=94029 RepID=UPI0024954B20|nr:uncharacterized protein LOC129956440 [Argiope bruennichi]